MKRSLLTLAALSLALPCSPVRAQVPDTVRFGDLVRIETPSLRPQTGRFLEADSGALVVALSRRGSEARIGRTDLLRLELPRGRDLGRGFRRGALVGGGIGAIVGTSLVTLLLLSCDDCTGDADPVVRVLAATAIFVVPPAVLGGLLGLAASPPRWQPAVLAPPSPAPSDLPRPDFGPLPVRVFARTQATVDSLGRAGERQGAAGAPGPDIMILVDEGHTGPAEVAYFHADDAAEAATVAFWLGRVLHQSPPATRLQRSPDLPRRIVAWLDR